MASRVCYVLLLSVLLAAAVSPGRAAVIALPDGEWIGGEEGQSENQVASVEVIDEDNLLTGPQNDSHPESQPEEEKSQVEGANVNITQGEADYENGNSEDDQPESEEDWWDAEEDWMEEEDPLVKPKEEEESKAEKPLWESWPITQRFWWGAEPKAEKPQWELKKVEVKPWWMEQDTTDRSQEWARPDLEQVNYAEIPEMKADDKMVKASESQWRTWPETKKPWWEAKTKAEEPWWKMDAKEDVSVERKWFPTKTQDEDKVRLDDSDKYEVLDVYIDNDEDDGDVLEEIPVHQEKFPPEIKENTVFHEKSRSGYFWAFLATLGILVAVLYMVYHKKRLSQQKRFIFALEGGLFGDNKRPNSGEYQRLENKI